MVVLLFASCRSAMSNEELFSKNLQGIMDSFAICQQLKGTCTYEEWRFSEEFT